MISLEASGRGCAQTRSKRSRDGGGFIVDGNDDGNFHGCPQIRRRWHLSECRLRPGRLHGPENMCRRYDSVPDMLRMLHDSQDRHHGARSACRSFAERSQRIAQERFQLLGGRFQFESDSPQLLRLVDSAYSGLPPHRLSTVRAAPEGQIAAERS